MPPLATSAFCDAIFCINLMWFVSPREHSRSPLLVFQLKSVSRGASVGALLEKVGAHDLNPRLLCSCRMLSPLDYQRFSSGTRSCSRR